MILGFSTKFPKGTRSLSGKPTDFVEKILNCKHYDLGIGSKLNKFLKFEILGYESKDALINKITVVKPKKHTIREDKKNRWKVGKDIHFAIGTRTKNYFQFAPVLKVKSIQKIQITHKEKESHSYTNVFLKDDRYFYKDIDVYVDEILLDIGLVSVLAINDGFDSLSDFFEYFNEDFTGKIIHWIDLKY